MKLFFALCALLGLGVLASGCGVTGTVLDLSNHETVTKRMRLERDRTFKIRHGGAVKYIPLRAVKTITLYQNESVTFDRDLYYEAKIELKGGTVFSSDTRAGKVGGKTYLCVSDALQGKTHKGRMRIGLDQVSRIYIK